MPNGRGNNADHEVTRPTAAQQEGVDVSEQTPPENLDYYKLSSSYRGSDAPTGRPDGGSLSERGTYIVMGIVLQAFGGLIVLVASQNGVHLAGEIIGGVISWVGVMLLFVGLVAVGVRLGTEELLRSSQKATSPTC
jgi:hypothetical protein